MVPLANKGAVEIDNRIASGSGHVLFCRKESEIPHVALQGDRKHQLLNLNGCPLPSKANYLFADGAA